jgi:hypothetical protein
MSKMVDATEPQFRKGQLRRATYVNERKDGKTHDEALAIVGVGYTAYRKWRHLYKDFAAQVDSINAPIRERRLSQGRWEGTFSQFRSEFFGHQSPWFHERIIQALEEGDPGSVTLITIPPEHGKTTTIEDYCNFKLGMSPTTRITVGSEKSDHSRKVLGRVKNRMETDGPYPFYARTFGPFRAPEKSHKKAKQPWAATHFDVFLKGNFDERDFSMAATGMGSAIAGTRTDLLIVDDPQSRKSLNRTGELFQIFRQDWLSRPGAKGRTVILMTRQGENDFADALIQSEILDYHIVLPAWHERYGWLWPERYSDEEYERMKRNVGQEAWEHNYMQIARPRHSIVFTRETIELGRNNNRSILNMRSPDHKPWPVIIGLDPGYNVAGLTAAIDGPKFQIIEARKPRNLSGTEALIAELEDLVARIHLPGEAYVSDVVIESKAFQKGLLTDERIMAMRRQYGFRILPHETGNNKYDEDLGVPQMVHSLLREEIEWPWGDELSRRQLKELEDDMYRWRPGIKGSRLEQDTLMATWFAWLLWRRRRRSQKAVKNYVQFNSSPAPRLLGPPRLVVPNRPMIGGRS